MNKRLILTLAALLALSLLLSACPSATPAEEAEPTPTPLPEGVVKVTWWTEPLLGTNREALLRDFVDTFNAAHPDIFLEVLFQPDLDRVTRTAIQGGAGPDIVQSPGPAFVIDYVEAGHVLPLDDYAVKYGWNKEIFSWALDVGKVDGHLYSLPLTYETMVLWYNKTLFDQHGWTPPTNRAELEALAEECQDQGIIPFAHANASWKAANEWYVGMFYSNYAGADKVYQALTQQIHWDDPLFVEAVALLKDYMDRGWFGGGRDNYYSLTLTDHWGALGDGTAAMKMEGTWGFMHAPIYFEGTGNEWEWAPLPKLRDEVTPVYDLGIGSTVSINAASPHPDAAAEVLDWLYSDPKRAAQLISDIGGGEYVVPIPLTEEDFPPEVDPRFIRALTTFSAKFAEGDYGYTTWTFWPARTEQYIISGIEEVWNGSLTPEAYCQEQQRLFAADLAAGKVPPIPVRQRSE